MNKKESMCWEVEFTLKFKKSISKCRTEKEFLQALDKKIVRLKEDPLLVGKRLCGEMHGFWSTRIVSKFRLIFRIDETNKTVFLEAIDHRKDVYE